jgi:hypothetical protein
MGLMNWTLGFVIFNLILLVYLFIFHLSHFRKYKSSFTIGLLIFVSVFFIQNAIAAYFYFTMMELYVAGTEIPVFFYTFVESLAFLVYIWIVRK